MDGHQISLALSDSLSADLCDSDCSGIGRFEDMPREELDCLFEQFEPSCTGPSFSSQDPPSPDAVPSSSLSSRETDPQLTPSSTTFELISDQGNVGDSPIDFATDYTNSPIAGFEHISPYSSRSSDYSHISHSIPRSFDGTTTPMQASRESSGGPTNGTAQQQWLSFDTSTSDNGDYVEVPQFTVAASANIFGPEASTTLTLTDRTIQQGQAWAPASIQSRTYGQSSWGNMHDQPLFSQLASFAQPAVQEPQPYNLYQTHLNQAANFSSMPTYLREHPMGSQLDMTVQRSNHGMPPRVAPSLSMPGRHQPTPRANLAHSTRLRFPDHPAIAAESKSPTSRRTPRTIAVANPEEIPVSARPGGSQDNKRKQGGRKLNSHLNQDARDRSSRMRKKGACWRCKLQRDPCPDDGTPCARCIIGSQKGQLYFFECNRSKLPDFVMDFLPPSYTIMHSKQNIEDCVKDQVRAWDFTRPVEVCLTSGYGQPLRWILYEFEPATLELLGQYQYLQNIHTRQPERCEKWSPPLGITKLEPSDDWHFKNYLDDLMIDETLAEFPWICFEEESQIDDFQATMLAMICQLYRGTNDTDLHQLLHKIIRMLIVTYIMGHTLTITQETLPMVHAHLRSSYKPIDLAPHTSPRLANRQLKFFFHVLRNQMYEDILKWQQATLHTSGGKNTTWLSTFIVMLAFAMVLEEAQRTIQIQADAKWRKRERSYDEAQQEASNACERIDARFQLLIGLFQCKYRDKKWVRGGSFGPQTPRLREPVEHDFCTQLRELLEERQNHLRSRKDVPFSSQTQCQYTTRLVARFLLPFLDLPC